MTGKSPSCGYYYLADLLCNTKNRLVITTNFDSLMEDALFISQSTHPLVAGHESLAPLIGNDSRRPVIAKIHRDLLYKPMNRREETQALAQSWIQPLSKVLSKYIPIVIGYSGGDQSLMSLLQELQLDGIFWCTRGEREKPSEKIQRIIEQHNGYWVPILGFDELLLQIYEKFNQEHMEHENICQKIRSMSEKNCGAFQKSFDKIKQDYDVSQKPIKSVAQSEDISGIITAIAHTEMSKTVDNANADLNNQLLAIQIALGAHQNQKAVALCKNALKRYPDESRIYNLRSTAWHNQENYQAALEDANAAIRLDPNNSQYYNSRQLTLLKVGQPEQALDDANRMIDLSPNNPGYYGSRSIILSGMGHLKEALMDITKAIQMNPDNALYYNVRGSVLQRMKRLDDALSDLSRAVLLSPYVPLYYGDRSSVLFEMRRFDEALYDINKAIDLSINKYSFNYYRRSIILFVLKDFDKALEDVTTAIQLDAQNAQLYRHRASILHALGREEEAQKDEETAKALSSQNDS